MISSNAVRHRGNNPSPPTNNNINNGGGNLAININTTDDYDNAINSSNHSTESHTKIHGGRFLRHNIIRRDELLLRSNNRNLYVVLGGALSIVALCLVGMWASNTSMSTTNHNPRHVYTIDHTNTVYNDIDAPSSHYRERKADERDGSSSTKRVHWNKRPRPRGHTGYPNRKNNEELFPIPESPRVQEEMKRYEKEEEEEQEPAEQVESKVSEDETKKQEILTAQEVESPRFHVKEPPNIDKEVVEESEGSDGSEEEEEKEVQTSKKKYRKVSNDDDDDEDNRANDEDSDENEVSPHEKEGNHAISNSLENEVPRKVVASSAREQQQQQQQQTSGRLQPRMLSLEFETYYPTKSSRGVKPLDVNHKNVLLKSIHRLPTYESRDIPTSDRYVTIYPDDDEYMDRLDSVKKSKKYARTGREPLEDKDCKPRHEWQKGAYPNCNILHEYELGALSGIFGRAVRKKLRKREGDGGELVKYLAHGYWRDVWLVSKTSGSFETEYDKESEFDEEITVLKTLRYRHDFTDRNYDRHRKDALATERLSKSPNVLNIFGYCSNSAIYEYGKGGDIDNKLWPYDEKEDKYYVSDISSSEKIDIAYQVARAIADMHDVEDDGFASIAHTDITPSQFIYVNGRWKLNDFNRCRFMRIYKDSNEPCGFYVGANPGKFRAPEEYRFDEEDEMIDVYSMGNIFYTLLAGDMPFEGQKESKAQKKVMDGIRPKIPEEVMESDDIAIQALISATKKAWKHEPRNRPSAASIAEELKEVMARIKEDGNDHKNVTRDEKVRR